MLKISAQNFADNSCFLPSKIEEERRSQINKTTNVTFVYSVKNSWFTTEAKSLALLLGKDRINMELHFWS